jgi:membrane protein DedA with SNARE-associated domain
LEDVDLASLIEAHGYWVLAAGCLLEGETVVVLAGFAAHRGYLDPFAVIGLAALMGFLGDQLYFWLGRRHGPYILARWPAVSRQADRVHRLIERYHAAVIIGVRFAYGLRIAGPILIGTSPVSVVRFALLNALGALLWGCLFGGAGWLFADAAEAMLGEIQQWEGRILLALAAAGAIAWAFRKLRAR